MKFSVALQLRPLRPLQVATIFVLQLPVFQNFEPTIKEIGNTDFTKGELKTDTTLRYVICFGSPLGNPRFPFPLY